MKMYELIVCCAVLTAAMPACQSQPTTVIVPVRRDRGTPPKADSPASRAAPPGSVATVRQSELVKVYGVNRYVDPSDPAIMHERHAIYRIEQKPEWVTRSPQNQGEILLGPVLGLRKPEYAPEPLPGETARDLVETHRASRKQIREFRPCEKTRKSSRGVLNPLPGERQKCSRN